MFLVFCWCHGCCISKPLVFGSPPVHLQDSAGFPNPARRRGCDPEQKFQRAANRREHIAQHVSCVLFFAITLKHINKIQQISNHMIYIYNTSRQYVAILKAAALAFLHTVNICKRILASQCKTLLAR